MVRSVSATRLVRQVAVGFSMLQLKPYQSSCSSSSLELMLVRFFILGQNCRFLYFECFVFLSCCCCLLLQAIQIFVETAIVSIHLLLYFRLYWCLNGLPGVVGQKAAHSKCALQSWSLNFVFFFFVKKFQILIYSVTSGDFFVFWLCKLFPFTFTLIQRGVNCFSLHVLFYQIAASFLYNFILMFYFLVYLFCSQMQKRRTHTASSQPTN